ncbi:MAG: tyrosine-type recombinase/integrase, partial [Wenzhouxiangellaceae bacterium]|nr:tyrosine-type recombinase/integrase [Wenzhouxiangellaceae bacterium]
MVPWALELPGVQGQSYRDTRGPGRDGFRRLLDQTSDSTKGRRDRLILRLLWDLALRREEVVSLDLEHIDPDAGTLSVLGKGRRERETLTLPPTTLSALQSWLEVRGNAPGPLVCNLDRRTGGRRLTGAGLYHVVRTLGNEAGVKVRP